MTSPAGLQLIEQGEDPGAVLMAETLLTIYRTCRILQLMDESGHHEWEDTTGDELGALVGALGEEVGIRPGDPESDRAVYDFIEYRMQGLAEMPYTDYLKTPEWQDVRFFALWRANDRCQTCNARTRLQVHHRTYDHRGRESLDDVTVLCGDCHGAFHEHRRLTRR